MIITCGKCHGSFGGYEAWAEHPCEVSPRGRAPTADGRIGTDPVARESGEGNAEALQAAAGPRRSPRQVA